MGREFEPEIVILFCQHSLADDADLMREMRLASGFKPRPVIMPCTSKIEVSHLVKIFGQGADGIEVVGCADGKCRFLTGSNLAEKRVEYTRRFLGQLQLGADRLGMHRGEGLSGNQMLELAEKRAKAISLLGPNPMKKET